jgi:hypothetical protein
MLTLSKISVLSIQYVPLDGLFFCPSHFGSFSLCPQATARPGPELSIRAAPWIGQKLES